MSKRYAKEYQKGTTSEIDYIGVRVTSTVNFTATLPTFELRSCPDYAIVIPQEPAEFVGTSVATKTVDVRYNLDVSTLDPGDYIVVLGLDIDSIRRRLKKLNIRVIEDVC
jgi:hypothetical protein